jgi:hypothetical protein
MYVDLTGLIMAAGTVLTELKIPLDATYPGNGLITFGLGSPLKAENGK